MYSFTFLDFIVQSIEKGKTTYYVLPLAFRIHFYGPTNSHPVNFVNESVTLPHNCFCYITTFFPSSVSPCLSQFDFYHTFLSQSAFLFANHMAE